MTLDQEYMLHGDKAGIFLSNKNHQLAAMWRGTEHNGYLYAENILELLAVRTVNRLQVSPTYIKI